jgi:Tfp pilus assembly protein PilV
MVALFIFALFVAGMAELLVKTKETSDMARDHYIAINLCKNQIERARAYDFEQLSVFNEVNTPVNESGVAVAGGDTRFQRNTTVAPVDTNDTNFLQMTVTVGIKDRRTLDFEGEGETVRTLIANLKGPPE